MLVRVASRMRNATIATCLLHLTHGPYLPCSYSPQTKTFYAWVENVATLKRTRLVLMRVANRMRNATIAAAWYTWRQWLEEEKMGQHQESKEQLAVSIRVWVCGCGCGCKTE